MPAISESTVAIGGIRERLAALYGHLASLVRRSAQGGGIELLLEIPFESGTPAARR